MDPSHYYFATRMHSLRNLNGSLQGGMCMLGEVFAWERDWCAEEENENIGYVQPISLIFAL